MPPFSVLDLAPVPEGFTTSDALRNTLDLAQHAERWGYNRYWLAEHHNMVGIASAATSVVIGHVAGGTKTMRVGAGGIMLPNHSPLVIAEQFGTLDALFPGRIDLGVGRAPGTDQRTLRALRRDPIAADTFPQDVLELQALLGTRPAGSGDPRRAGRRLQRADLDSGLKPVRRAACGDAGPALRLRLAFRAGRADAGAAGLSRALPALRAARPALCHGRRQRDRSRYRRGGAPPLHLAAAILHQPVPRRPRQAPAAHRRYREPTGRRARKRRR